MTILSSVKHFPQEFLIPLSISTQNHRIIQLPNGILVLLISDPSEDLASSAVCVATGAHADPSVVLGLAHFCEHMLTLGSKQFPDPDGFHKLVGSSGGRSNAFTTGEQTVFFFEVPTNSTSHTDTIALTMVETSFNFEKIMQVFASYFKKPLLSSNSQKELFAVDNEHSANTARTSRILYHGLRLLSNKNHPFSRFATGNINTLSEIPSNEKVNMHRQLVKFFDKEYSAERMTLVIRGPQSLNHLQEVAFTNFDDIPLKNPLLNSDLNEFSILETWKARYNGQRVFEPNNLRQIMFIKSKKALVLRFTFPVPFGVLDEAMIQLLNRAWSSLFGDEGEGSLASELKEAGLISSLRASSTSLAQGDDLLTLELSLTSKGVREVKKSIDMVSLYARTATDAVTGRFLSDSFSIHLLNYLHQDVASSPMDEASRYSQTLQKNLSQLNPRNIFRDSPSWSDMPYYSGGFGESRRATSWWTYHAKNFTKYLETFVNLDNCNLLVMGKNIKMLNFLSVDDVKLETDLAFDIEYHIFRDVKLKVPNTLSPLMIHPNPFLASVAPSQLHLIRDLDLCSRVSTTSFLSFINTHVEVTPSLISHDCRHKLWFKTTTSSLYSRAFITFELASALKPSPTLTINLEILCEAVAIRLRKELYPAEMLGYSWLIQPSIKGDGRATFTFSGFSCGLYSMIERVIRCFKVAIGDPEHVDTRILREARRNVRLTYEGLAKENGLVLCSAGMLVFMEQHTWQLEDRVERLEEITFEETRNSWRSWLGSDLHATALVHGDCDEESAHRVMALLDEFCGRYRKPQTFHEPSTYIIPQGKCFAYESCMAEGDPMNCVSIYLQTGIRHDPYIHTLSKLLAYAMSLSLVPDLRTKKQLGYAVLGGLRVFREMVGLHITVMSGTYRPRFLHQKIEDYIAEWEVQLSRLSEREFQHEVLKPFIDSYANNKQRLQSSGGPENLAMAMNGGSGGAFDGSGRNVREHKLLWDQITTHHGDKSEVDLDVIRAITKGEFMAFFTNKISVNSRQRAKLSIMLRSRISQAEVQKQMTKQQIQTFLRMNLLYIPPKDLDAILEASGSNRALSKNLLKYFAQRSSLKSCRVIIVQLMKGIGALLKFKQQEVTRTVRIQDFEIKSIEEFHSLCKVYS
ncbi:hypothetical protein BABINDRAFT_7101 [Babjeviella inositovora NRRL Y-12698]|uniref:Peptidase M16 N-terminal domain-containing protein n=1 Tax=Babjeviella inositovora NRRL Y-12698 TaxID=984486 RepID=A0A1E3QUE4_9ASCO|nr:uncharacterized protein BABINDRAFT_7101 [Babjeviella inositovora NRRL Y-12698]ODQ81290.1 hypothetical protein BABINDRAFT_7101 [Babjeviella inositovora NRRL Y-12698]